MGHQILALEVELEKDFLYFITSFYLRLKRSTVIKTSFRRVP